MIAGINYDQIQSVPTGQHWLYPPLGANLVATGARYSPFGRYSLFAITPGATYLWIGTGGETCSNDGNMEASNVPFVAADITLLLQGTPDAFITATVQRVNRPA